METFLSLSRSLSLGTAIVQGHAPTQLRSIRIRHLRARTIGTLFSVGASHATLKQATVNRLRGTTRKASLAFHNYVHI